MDRTSREDWEERDFGNTVGVQVSETSHGFSNDSVQFLVINMPVGTVYAVLR